MSSPDIQAAADVALTFHRHEVAKLEKPSKLNLIYTLEGTESGLKPLILTAHQVRLTFLHLVIHCSPR